MNKTKKTFGVVDAKQIVGVAQQDLARVVGGIKADSVDMPVASDYVTKRR